MSEAERIVQHNPDSAPLNMGAAWMLDSPSPQFMGDHVRLADFGADYGATNIGAAMPQFGVTLEFQAISQQNAQFRSATRSKCLELAATATQLGSHDPQWRRMRAMLLFEGMDDLQSGGRFEPRTTNWLAVLDDCAAHDGENALYDYLAALVLWEESAKYDWTSSGGDERLVLTVDDEHKFALGADRFLSAQNREFLAVGEQGYPAVAEFLRHSDIDKIDQSNAAAGRLIAFRQSALFLNLWRWQQARADGASQVGDSALALAIHLQCLRLFDQAIAPPETSALNVLATFSDLRSASVNAVEQIASADRRAIPLAELEQVRERDRSLQIEAAALRAALRELDHKNQAAPDNRLLLLLSIGCQATIALSAMLLLAGALLLAIAARIARNGEPAERLGAIRRTAAWLAGCGGSFVVLGMAPAEFISRDMQSRAVVAGLGVIALAVLGAAAWFAAILLRRRQLRWWGAALLTTTVGVVVLVPLWPLVEGTGAGAADGSPVLRLPAKSLNGVDAEALRLAMNLNAGSWSWAAVQWFAYRGPYVGVLLSLVVSGAWMIWLTARRHGETSWTDGFRSARPRWGALSRALGKSCLDAAAWVFLIYLCIAPQYVSEAETHYQRTMSFCRDPHARWTQIRELSEQIRNEDSAIRSVP
ncbi:MAG: hypothetical protein KF688_03785 [Pirellulales bacterium]|nr:hypothetical protein [Pirellulales bacterium]